MHLSHCEKFKKTHQTEQKLMQRCVAIPCQAKKPVSLQPISTENGKQTQYPIKTDVEYTVNAEPHGEHRLQRKTYS